VAQDDALVCRRCGTVRPRVCLACGSGALKNLRPGVSRVREELEALARRPVAEVTGMTDEVADAPIHVGTEAVLHRIDAADVVVFLDFDQELLAPRHRAAEEALALVVRACRLVGGRRDGGRVLLQTRLPGHEVCQAALLGDPTRVADAERERRRLLGYPPYATVAAVSGPAAPTFVERFDHPDRVEVQGPSDGRWLLRSADRPALLDALAATTRPPGRLRIAVDPLRL
jgi:primosomal protein N' (replication factor Y)